jgi:hypothetical protein
MNKISQEKVEKLQALFAAGFTLRQAAKRAGVSRHTAQRYAREMPPMLCPCGQPSSHQGWCTIRVGRSENRQRFLARFASGGIKPSTKRRWHRQASAEVLIVDLLIEIRNNRAARLASLRASRAQNISASELIERVLRSLPQQLTPEAREEIRQDLFVAVLEGKVDFQQIKAAVPEYVRRFYSLNGTKFGPLSLDEINRDERTLRDRI